MTFANRNQRPQQKSLLCVDDEPIIRELCVDVLSDYHVLEAKDGLEAEKILKTLEVDIVLSDVKMPNLDGLGLLKSIKEQYPDQAVILMTGYSDQDLILQALKAGADDFINKPINILQLSTTVEKVFEKQKIRQELADLKRTEQLKNNFLGLISHKLKTPATAISLFIQNIAEGIESPEDENFQQMITMVQAETAHLEQLIQDLLYFSEATLTEETSTLEAVDLGALADRVSLSLQTAALHSGVTLETNIDPHLAQKPLMLNAQRISFAIRALLDNAIKFTPKGGAIQLTAKVDQQQITLLIKDDGIGISQQELAKIFNKFYQIDPEHTGQVRGFGLGLYYAREFIRSMGGQVYVESQPGQGATATIEFPL
ncbi:Signal transduction histidine kinase [Desulfuromusa kysingii]|uniref:histidine kinase n=1 Tax=Desulfuromusa kysingii TaxID=37625 RepID=A0A1H3VXI1_9BACT|nr:hybrid sensor histidine kinase/response regulator [Desulfuromusa kysingii]SDZ79450.1 Signal transduction histidine kinase [Desulfuromusa kysingii]